MVNLRSLIWGQPQHRENSALGRNPLSAKPLRKLPRVAAIYLLLVFLPLILSLASCDLLTMDMFPSYLSYEIAQVDLKGELAKKGVSGPWSLEKTAVLYTPLTGKRYVLLYLFVPLGTPWLAVMDGENLDVKTVVQDAFLGSMLTVDMDGYLVSAGSSGANVVRLDPRNFTYSTVGTTIDTGNVEAFTDGTTGTTYVVQYSSVSPGNLNYRSYTTPWYSGTYSSKTLDSVFYWDLYLSSIYYEWGVVRFLMTSSTGSSFAVRFPTITAFTNAFSSTSIFQDSNALVVSLPPVNNNGGWLTRGGVIFLKKDKEDQLVRYNPDTGSELDSLTVKGFGDIRFGFSSDGQRWTLYEAETGKLHLLRTWW